MVLAGVVWREALKGTCFKGCGPRGVGYIVLQFLTSR